MDATMLWWMTGAALAVAAWAVFADRRRLRRRNPDRPGWVPWPLVLLTALIAAILCAALAVRA